ncbi:Capsular polysaccharide export system inner membrane protein KpsE [Vibrio chagasii]|nr:Capsular polysaccharide export system inner membrane protein KpsE [Vibrio chagasii]
MTLKIFDKIRTKKRYQLPFVFALSLVYYSFVAPSEYTSQSVFVVKSISEEQTPPTGLELFGSAVSSNSTTPVIQAYLNSAAIAKVLDKNLGYFQHLRDGSGVLGYLKYTSGLDAFFKQSTNFIELRTGTSDDVLFLNTTAYMPEMAQDMNNTIKGSLEDLVEQINYKKLDAKIENSQTMLKNSRDELQEANSKLDVLRTELNSVSPSVDLEIQRTNIAGLEKELMSAQAKLAEKRSYLSSESSTVRQLVAKVTAISERIKKEGATSVMLSQSYDYEQLQFEVDVLQKSYQYAQASLEQVRQEALKSTVTLVDISQATLPTRKMKPRVLFDSVNMTVIVGVLLVLMRISRELIMDKKGKR